MYTNFSWCILIALPLFSLVVHFFALVIKQSTRPRSPAGSRSVRGRSLLQENDTDSIRSGGQSSGSPSKPRACRVTSRSEWKYMYYDWRVKKHKSVGCVFPLSLSTSRRTPVYSCMHFCWHRFNDLYVSTRISGWLFVCKQIDRKRYPCSLAFLPPPPHFLCAFAKCC